MRLHNFLRTVISNLGNDGYKKTRAFRNPDWQLVTGNWQLNIMLGGIFAPQEILTGAFSVLFSFNRALDFSRDDIDIQTLEGDALGHTKDTFGGEGAHYYLQCYLQENQLGTSEISLKRYHAAPVIVQYDTVRTLVPTFGKPFARNRKIEVPILLPAPIIGLKKKHFRVPEGIPYQVFGSGRAYQLLLSGSGVVTLAGSVRKESGVKAQIVETTFEVNDGIIH